MLYREIIAVCSQIHTKHINTLCGQNVELLNDKRGSPYSKTLDLNNSVALQQCTFLSSVYCTYFIALRATGMTRIDTLGLDGTTSNYV